jgi:hypothetical protein
VARLGRRQRRDPFDSRGWLSVDAARVQGIDRTLVRRLVLTTGFALALLCGATSGPALVASLNTFGNDDESVLVRSVAVQGNVRLNAATVALASGVARDSIASQLDPKQIEAKLESHPMIRAARVALLPDGQLVVRIAEREPHALLLRRGGKADAPAWRLIDADGTPFADTRAEAWSRLPRVRSDAVIESDVASAPLREAIALAQAMDDPRFAALGEREIELPAVASSDGWVLHARGNPRRVVLGTREVEPRLERLALLLDADLPAARTATEIDFRFAGQAVLRSGSASR